jgi:hypothetical protein
MKKLSIIITALFIAGAVSGQVAQSFGFKDYSFSNQVNMGAGARTTAPSAVLELGASSGSTKGFLLPRGNHSDVVAPATGLMFYDITDHHVWQFDGSIWQQVGGAAVLGFNQVGVGDASGKLSGSSSMTYDGSTLTVTGTGVFTGAISASTGAFGGSIIAGGNGTFTGAVTAGQSLSAGSWVKVGSLSADPSASNGSIYYNTTSNQFRIFQNGSWVNMAPDYSATFIQNQTSSLQSAGFKISGPATIGDGTTAGQGQWVATPSTTAGSYFLTYGGNAVNQGFMKMDAANIGGTGWPGIISLTGTTPAVLSSATTVPWPIFKIDIQTASPDVAMTGYSSKIYRTANMIGTVNTIGFNADVDGGGQTGANATAFYASATLGNASPTGKAYAFYANSGMIRLANVATDPAGTDGAMIYNTANGKTKIYQNGQWNNVGFEGSFVQLYPTPSSVSSQTGGFRVGNSIVSNFALGGIGSFLRIEGNGAALFSLLSSTNGWANMEAGNFTAHTIAAPSGLTYRVIINDQGVMSSQAISTNATEAVTVNSASTYSVASGDVNIFTEYGSGTATITLPSASTNTGRVLYISNTSANSVTFSTSVRSATTTTTTTLGASARCKLVSNGTDWWIITL